MKTLLYLYQKDFWLRGRRFAGIAAFARANALRARQAALDELGIGVEEAVAAFRADGCILEEGLLSRLKMRPRDFPVPVAVCDPTPEQVADGFTGVRHDSEHACRKAIEELLALGCGDLAYARHPQPHHWSAAREQVFLERVRAAGRTAHVLPWVNRRRGSRLAEYFAALERWLAALPRPCALLAANDETGEYVLDAAARAKVAVPAQLAVIGIDNDEARCAATDPPLASVSPDFEQSGRLVAEVLWQTLRARGSAPPPAAYGAGEVVRRGTLRPLRTRDAAARRAVAFIAEHAGEPVGVADVARAMGLKPRMAQVRFMRSEGRTIFDELEDVRFARACEILRDARLKVATAARRCGYRTERAFRKMFVKRSGLSPSRWREAHL